MSFSARVKKEIGQHGNHGRHCQIAELLALVLATGEVELKDGQVKVIMRPENVLIGDKLCYLMDKIFGKEVLTTRHSKYIEIANQDMADRLLQTVKLSDYVDYLEEDWLDEDELSEIERDDITYVSSRGVSLQNCHFPRQVIQKDCCKKAFIRGMFLATGSVNDPNKAYHFEIVVHNREMAETVKEVINSFSLDAKVVKRKKYYIVYLKEGSMIVDILNIMEAHISLMDMENIRILKDMRNDINRRVNCETANIKKTVNAARRQIEDIEYIEKTKGLKYLNDSLRQLAELRLEEPDANLSELGEMLNPPVSKSGVNHRLRKISNIAKVLRENNQI
ncbi:MAG: DNA-binding protein WhiA [Lachnospiraceae bacterium]|nr:DNA-binding protein WhiA [Lachnospiraceae bacterium]